MDQKLKGLPDTAVSCLACHDPKNSKPAYKLVASPEDLCESCHKQRAMLKGEGAKGIDDVRNVRSAVNCVSCNMTEANHRMKVLRPDDPGLTEKRIDNLHRVPQRQQQGGARQATPGMAKRL